MHSAFFPLILVSLCGVLFASTSRHTEGVLQWSGLIAGLVPLALYHVMLWRKRLISSTEIDSVYYFGFLVTVITLVSTAVSLGLAPKNTLNLQWILLQFGLGLIATGYALFARLHLLSKATSTADTDVVDSTEKLAKAVEKVAGEFDKAGFQVAAFVEQTEKRMADLEQRVATKFASAEAKFEQRMTEAQNAFNEALAKSAALSLERAAGVIDQATSRFSEAISEVMEEVIRIQSEAEGISFTKASERISEFSTEMESSIKSISTSVSEASKASAGSVAELATTFNKTSKLATEISKKLDNLDKLSVLTEAIVNASKAITDIAKSSVEAEAALSSLAAKSAIAEQGIRESVINPLENIDFAKALTSAENSITTVGKVVSESLDTMNQSLSPISEKMTSLVSKIESSVDSTSAIVVGAKGLSNSMSEFETSVRSAASVIAAAGATAGTIQTFDAGVHAASSRLTDSLAKLGEHADGLSILLGKATPSLDKAISAAASGLGTIESRLAALDDLASSARMASQQMRSAALSAAANQHTVLTPSTYMPKQPSSPDQSGIV